jgi:hypothetical protein
VLDPDVESGGGQAVGRGLPKESGHDGKSWIGFLVELRPGRIEQITASVQEPKPAGSFGFRLSGPR